MMKQRQGIQVVAACCTCVALGSILHAPPTVGAWAPQHYSFLRQPQPLPLALSIRSRLSKPKSRQLFASTADSGSSSGGAVDDDWREFRAQLVRSEHDENENNNVDTPKQKQKDDDDHWAYETGDFVERGSIVISVPSSNDYLNDIDALNNICYRKSIVLVLDAGQNFIQGIVLNRPTNIGVKDGSNSGVEDDSGNMQFVQPGHGEVFENEMGDCLGENCELIDADDSTPHSARWKVWFGGEVGGPYSDYPQVMCLHSLTSESARAVSDCVLPGIFVTSFSGAQKLVLAGDADPSDFWLFCGICGWETTTFYQEMHEEGLWHIVSADSETILEELNMLRCDEEEELAVTQNCDIDHDPRNAGLHTWEMLMEKIGLDKEAHETEDSFGDLMLHEWATGALSFSIQEEQTSMIMEPSSDPRFEIDDESGFDLSEYDPASAMSVDLQGVTQPQSPGMVGVMVRASSAKRSPYLLSDQGFHKSILLILRDGEEYSEGVLLNHMTSRSRTLDLGDETVDLPIRYGGPAYYYANDEDDASDVPTSTVFLHSSDSLRNAGVGAPVGKSRLFKCTEEEVTKALKSGLAEVDDIMAIQGFSVWTKKGEHTGVLGDVEGGFFELVPRPKVPQIWKVLQMQEQLTEVNLSSNVSKSRQAWNAASRDATKEGSGGTSEDEFRVFGTDVGVSTLADEAAIRWVKISLL